jgi:hypothetical protein
VAVAFSGNVRWRGGCGVLRGIVVMVESPRGIDHSLRFGGICATISQVIGYQRIRQCIGDRVEHVARQRGRLRNLFAVVSRFPLTVPCTSNRFW